MLRIERKRQTVQTSRGYQIAVLDLQASDYTDIPVLGGIVETNYIVAPGSIVQIIQTGEFATLDDDGSWYADGEEIG